MASESRKIYRKRGPLRLILKIIFGLALIAVILATVIFFWFQTYIVYTPDGVRLDIPFLDRGEAVETAEDMGGE